MFGVNDLITKINAAIASGTATEDQIEYLSSAVNSLRQYGTAIAATPADLPSAATNKGRFFYIKSTGQYTFSNGVVWDLSKMMRLAVTPLYAWGRGLSGQLGDGTVADKSSPVSVVGGFTDWVQVSGGFNHTAGVRANGTAWTWGSNAYGQLGDNATTNKSSPVSVVGGFTDWVQIDVGANHTTALRANGTVWAWGRDNYGQLGDNATTNKSSPVSVVGGFTDWVEVDAGSGHTIGLRANGTAWAWGRGDTGQLGDNTIVSKSSPVSVVGGFTDWVQVSGGAGHTIGLRANGTAWAWGWNSSGQLGDNATTNKSSPVSVVGGFTDWVEVDAGSGHTVGVRFNGTAWAWGSNASGQLGDNTTVNKSSPVSVVGGFTDWVQVIAGNSHTAGVRANGTAWTWGSNAYGRLGDNTTVSKSSPVSVVGGFTDWVQVSSHPASQFTIALRAT